MATAVQAANFVYFPLHQVMNINNPGANTDLTNVCTVVKET